MSGLKSGRWNWAEDKTKQSKPRKQAWILHGDYASIILQTELSVSSNFHDALVTDHQDDVADCQDKLILFFFLCKNSGPDFVLLSIVDPSI